MGPGPRSGVIDESPAPTPFVGRAEAVAGAAALVAGGARLVTMCGPGGVGKTRLALRVASVAGGAFAHGAWFVALADVRDPDHVPGAVARALGIDVPASREPAAAVSDHLAHRQTLLVLDNFEQVMQGATFVGRLLEAARELTVVVTSREPLQLAGEHEFHVEPMEVPAAGPLSPEAAAESDAVALFVARAQNVRPDFVLDGASAPVVAELCRRVDGLPLAIEIVAARMRLLGPAEILARLTRVLAGQAPGPVPERHRSLQATLDWSHELLEPDERALYRRMSVFAGGATLDSIEAVCSGVERGAYSILDVLTGLVEKSLVSARPSVGRFAMLEMVRQDAEQRLAASGEERAVRAAHLVRFLELAGAAAAEESGPAQASWYDRLAEEHENFRSAMRWALRADPERALRMAALLGLYWDVRGHWTEGRAWLSSVVDSAPTASADMPAALRSAGRLAWAAGDYEGAVALFDRQLATAEAGGRDAEVADALNNLGTARIDLGVPDEGAELLERSAELFRRAGDAGGEGRALTNLGRAAMRTGEGDDARRLFEEGLALSQRGGNLRSQARALGNLALLAWQKGDLSLARARYAESLEIFRRLRDERMVVQCLTALGIASAQLGDHVAAAGHFEEAIETADRLRLDEAAAECRYLAAVTARIRGLDADAAPMLDAAVSFFASSSDEDNVAACLVTCAGLAAVLGEAWNGARLLGAAVSRDAQAAGELPVPEVARPLADRDVARLRAELGESGLARAREAGSGLSLGEAVALARELCSRAASVAAGVSAGKETAKDNSCVFRRAGDSWSFTFRSRTFLLADSKGLRCLRFLLASPGREFHVLDLAATVEGGAQHARARDAYRRRLDDLREEQSEAEGIGDAERIARVQDEIDSVARELAAAVGLSAGDTPAASAAERARVNLTRTVKDAIRKVAHEEPVLGHYLESTVRTGRFFAYAPPPEGAVVFR